ncbi:ribosomal protein S5 domain 2-type protein [Lentinula raphanica]|uniref:Ribosomal protein S5 domain 2-type protein n=1 Tax=Lentinula raphanica TaxID=153919 RepID=A0AA38UJG6_9AGAR|nr:ribosomal protein S5 domain 2-type protein [Lentinula raphanica]
MFFCPRQRITSLVRRHHFSTSMAEWPYPIYSSERLHDRKSIFLAHASHLPNNTMLPLFLEVLTTSPKLKKATHCMYAYRTSEAEPEPSAANPNSKTVTGQHDGGENGSGNQLARLLDVTGCENTVVVVSRWYGGVQLGGDRWRRISHVAKEALDKGGFCVSRDEATEKSRKKGRKKGK